MMNVENQVFWSPGVTLDQLEKEVIAKAYIFFRKNKTSTAASLGISVKTLDNKLERYEMEEIEEAARREDRKKLSEQELHRQRWGTGPGESHTNGFATVAAPVTVTTKQVGGKRK